MKNILIKGSGDVLGSPKFIRFIKEKTRKNNIVVICGGGTQISKALIEAGYEIRYDHLGRITKTEEEKDIARKILEKERKNLKRSLNDRNIHIISPILKIGSVECHINADNLVKACYLGFDSVYVFTLKNRVINKKKIFKDYPRIKFVGINK
jgi:acetylglutamate kinase